MKSTSGGVSGEKQTKNNTQKIIVTSIIAGVILIGFSVLYIKHGFQVEDYCP